MTVSVVILTKNEEHMIAECIRSVSFADEIVVVDSGSTDTTAEIAKQLNAHVITHPLKNFSDQRSFALQQVTGDWILYIDADERVSRELREEIVKITNYEIRNTKCAYRITRKNYYLGNHEWPVLEKHVRLFRRESLMGWSGDIHETPIVQGDIGELKGYLLHYTHRDLSGMVEKTLFWSDIEVTQLVKSNHPPMVAWRFVRIMFTKFFDSYIVQKGWKAGTIGLIESMFQAYSYFIIYAKLWERQRRHTER